MIQCVECGRDLIYAEDKDNFVCTQCQNERLDKIVEFVKQELRHEKPDLCSYINMPND